jgi:DNA uptake protein ComE-like DNA-binding protein
VKLIAEINKRSRLKLVCRATVTSCVAVALLGGLVVLTSSPVRALAGDLAVVKGASALDGDPQDAVAVTAVCTVCHAASQFISTPRSSIRWKQVYEQMSGYGADGTDDQLDRVVAYFQKNLTVISANTSPVEDIEETLQVSDSVAATIMARRTQRPFTGIDDLSKVAGVNRSILEKLSARNCLQF